jgi:type II secretory pathway pseudopilin PulG
MKTNPRRGRAAFTLIELMAVITIIIILAGLVISGMGFVNDRQAKAKAQVQIGMLSKALDDYKSDNGAYPATEDSLDGKGNSDDLFKALYFDGAQDTTGVKRIYISELDPATNKQGWTTGTASASTTIKDPWGNEYRYRTAINAAGTANTNTQNPDFDLWSVGKDGETDPGSPGDKKNADDIKNF